MKKSAMIRARIEPELKTEVEAIFKELGLTATEAITMFYHQVKVGKSVPFKLKIPKKITLETAKKTDSGKELNEYKSLDEFRGKVCD